ncbi:MAG: hypothetical protein AAGD09_03460 [Cyanobacteria bacterium P01_F01_bin.56]
MKSVYSVQIGTNEEGLPEITGLLNGSIVIKVGQSQRTDGIVWRVDTSQALPVYPDIAKQILKVQALVFQEMEEFNRG